MNRPAKQSMGVMQMRTVVEAGDRVEVGRQGSPQLRVAFEVTDAEGATRRLAKTGADLSAPPTRTPWDSLNSRLACPAGLQLTLVEGLAPYSRPS